MKNSFVRAIGLVLALLLLSGCLSTKTYVDPGLKDVPVSELKKPAKPQAAQLVFEFQTNGATNARATEFLKDKVTQYVKKSTLFTDVSATPVANSPMLSITINNIADLDDAVSKGFSTGLTLGFSGTTVTDRYVCKMTYNRASGIAVTKTVNHAVHTTVGNSEGPPGLVASESAEAAVLKAVEQMIFNDLKQLSDDPVFHN